MILLKRVYEPYSSKDTFRILVDRLWPRGISKEKAKLDLWLKEIAPSDELRKWFHAHLDKWKEFEDKYFHELKEKKELVNQLKQLEKEYKTITLLYSSNNTEHNNAVVLMDYLQKS